LETIEEEKKRDKLKSLKGSAKKNDLRLSLHRFTLNMDLHI